MAQKLETLEDFQRVAKALLDPKAQPHEYQVKSFGFCKQCEQITEYFGSYGPEWLEEECLSCGTRSAGAMGSFRSLIMTDEKVPVMAKAQIDAIHSREMQKKFLLEIIRVTAENWAAQARSLQRQHRQKETHTLILMKLLNKVSRSLTPQ